MFLVGIGLFVLRMGVRIMANKIIKALMSTIALGALISAQTELAVARGPGGGHGVSSAHVSGPHGVSGAHVGGFHGFSAAHVSGAHGFSSSHIRSFAHTRTFTHSRNFAHTRTYAHSRNFVHGSNFSRNNTIKGLARRNTGKNFAHNNSSKNFAYNKNFAANGKNWNKWGNSYSKASWNGNWHGWNGGWNGGCCWWSGSVFWPFFYGDLLSFVFWPVGFYYPIWWFDPYVFVWDTIFWPGPYYYAYGYGPPYYDYDIYGDYGYYDGYTRRHYARKRYAARNTTGSVTANAEELAQSCNGLAPGITDLPIDRIQTSLNLTDDQLKALDALKAASSHASDVLKASCSSEMPLTPVARINAVQKRTDGMIQAVEIVRTPLDNFYSALNDEQRKKFAALGPTAGTRTSRRKSASANDLAALCNRRTESFTQLPVERIERVIKPTQEQRGTLDKLKSASMEAANQLQASCPTEMPQAPIDRLDTVAKRLRAMSAAIKTVHPALESFYASLTDEQKAQFNVLGPPKTSSSSRG